MILNIPEEIVGKVRAKVRKEHPTLVDRQQLEVHTRMKIKEVLLKWCEVE